MGSSEAHVRLSSIPRGRLDCQTRQAIGGLRPWKWHALLGRRGFSIAPDRLSYRLRVLFTHPRNSNRGSKSQRWRLGPALATISWEIAACVDNAHPSQSLGTGRSRRSLDGRSLHRYRAATASKRRIVIPNGQRRAAPEPSQSESRGAWAGWRSSSNGDPIECAVMLRPLG